MTDKKTEALKLARDALEHISSHYMSLPKRGCMALAAVEEALAEQPAQQQEPVASKQTFTRAEVIRAIEAERHACSIAVWMTLMEATEPDADDKGLAGWMTEAEQRIKNRSSNDPEAAQQQEPVAYVYEREIDGFGLRKDVKFLKPVEVGADLYAFPKSSKPWVGLTRDERMSIINRLIGQDWVYALDAIEAKLKEKNA